MLAYHVLQRWLYYVSTQPTASRENACVCMVNSHDQLVTYPLYFAHTHPEDVCHRKGSVCTHANCICVLLVTVRIALSEALCYSHGPYQNLCKIFRISEWVTPVSYKITPSSKQGAITSATLVDGHEVWFIRFLDERRFDSCVSSLCSNEGESRKEPCTAKFTVTCSECP